MQLKYAGILYMVHARQVPSQNMSKNDEKFYDALNRYRPLIFLDLMGDIDITS